MGGVNLTHTRAHETYTESCSIVHMTTTTATRTSPLTGIVSADCNAIALSNDRVLLDLSGRRREMKERWRAVVNVVNHMYAHRSLPFTF